MSDTTHSRRSISAHGNNILSLQKNIPSKIINEDKNSKKAYQ